MFNLETAISKWRKQLRKNPALEDGYIEELESHLRDETDKNIGRGLGDEEAFNDAVSKIGRVDNVGKEYYKSDSTHISKRPSWETPKWMPVLFSNYFKIALRNIKKYKSYSFINILGLSIGMASFILIFLFVQSELSYDTYNKNYNNIYRVVGRFLGHSHSGVNEIALTRGPVGPLMKSEIPEVINYTRISTMNDVKIFSNDKGFDEEEIYFVEPSFFDIFTFNLVSGELSSFSDNPFSVIITKRAAKKYFGDSSPVGKVINLKKEQDFTVAGVIENMPFNSHFNMDIIFTLDAYIRMTREDFTDWHSYPCYTYVLFREGTDYKKVDEKLKILTEQYAPKSHGHASSELFLQPIKDIHLYSQMIAELSTNGDIETIYTFSSIAILILLIACINYMNLATARSTNRKREVGIRKTIGATRFQLIKQFFSESVILSIIALALAYIIVLLVIPSFNDYVGRKISASVADNLTLVIGLTALIFFVGMFAGSYPALYLSSFNPAKILKNEFEGRRIKLFLRNLLVVLQFGISIILIISTVVIKGQLGFILSSDVGYKKDQIITIDLYDAEETQTLAPLKNELMSNSNILNVSSSTYPPNAIGNQTEFDWVGKPADLELPAYCGSIDYNFIDLYNIKITKGRNFSQEYSSDAAGAFLINETAEKLLSWENPIGRELIHWSGKKGKIVGVMKDFNFSPLHLKIEPLYLFLDPNFRNYLLSVNVSGLNLPGTIKFIEEKFNTIYPKYPFKYEFFDEAFSNAYKTEQDMGNGFSVFSLIAIFISCLGLLGLASFTAESRTKEIGIRKVMGARISEISYQLIKDFIKWVLVANIVAWPVAYYFMNNWLQDFAYRSELTIWIFLLSGVIALGIACVAVAYQAIRAASANPVKSLRYE